jgi:hypothetical protein
LAVTITKDSTFDPKPYYPDARGVTFAVKVTNGTSAPFAVSSITNGPRETVDGTTPSLIVNVKDSKAGAGTYDATVLPGKSFTYYATIGLDTPPAEVQLEWKRDYTSPPAIFTGQVSPPDSPHPCAAGPTTGRPAAPPHADPGAPSMTATLTAAAAAKLARAACRPDLAEVLETLDVILTETIQHEKRDLTDGDRPSSTVDHTLDRWQAGDRTLWLYIETTVDWGGGDGSSWEDLILTEYPLDNEEVRDAVLAVCDHVNPSTFESYWSATPTRAGLPGVDTGAALARLRDDLNTGLRAWATAVTALRALDPRPVPPPVQGGREL